MNPTPMLRWAMRRLLAIAAAVTSLLLSALLALINSANAAASCSAFHAAHPLPLPHLRFSPLHKPPPHQLATPTVQTEALAHRALMRRHPAATATGAAGVNACPHFSSLLPVSPPLRGGSARAGAAAGGVERVGRQQQRHHGVLCVGWRHLQPQRSRACPVSRNGAVLAL
ncbi:unnamed protein product [Closterium sp. NIES-54]